MTQTLKTPNLECPNILNVPDKLKVFIDEFKKYRYFLIEGGRGSAKSQTVARLLLYLCYKYLIRIFCGREIQNKIEESVYTLFKDLITEYSLNFNVQSTKIDHNSTKSTIKFRGFREQGAVSIQGIEGADILWIDEAQAITKPTLDVIIPTIRKQHAKIIFTMNRFLADDPVYIFLKGRPDCLHIHIDYFENKHCPEALKNEAEMCKKRNLDDYNHIWLGLPLKQADDAAFRNVAAIVRGSFNEPAPGVEYVIGVDLAKSIDFTWFVVLNPRTKNVDYLEYLENENKSSWFYQEERCVALAKKFNNALIVPDASGVGDPLVERWHRRGLNVFHSIKENSEIEVPGVKFNAINKENIIEKLKVAIELNLISIPDDKRLVDELTSYRAIKTASGRISYSAPEGKHDDGVIALALALWGIRQEVYEIWKEEKPKTPTDDFWDVVRNDLAEKNTEKELKVNEEEGYNIVDGENSV